MPTLSCPGGFKSLGTEELSDYTDEEESDDSPEVVGFWGSEAAARTFRVAGSPSQAGYLIASVVSFVCAISIIFATRSTADVLEDVDTILPSNATADVLEDIDIFGTALAREMLDIAAAYNADAVPPSIVPLADNTIIENTSLAITENESLADLINDSLVVSAGDAPAKTAATHVGTPTMPPKFALVGPAAAKAECVVGADALAIGVANLGLIIDKVVQFCTDPITPQQHTACLSVVSNFMRGISALATVSSGMASTCTHTLNLPAYCSAIISSLATSLAGITAATSGAATSCNPNNFQNPPNPPPVQDELEDRLAQRPAQLATCAVTLANSGNSLAQVGLTINYGSKRCAYVGKGNGLQGRWCALTITSVIKSFAAIASFLTTASVNCAQAVDPKAACVSKVAQFTSMTLGIANFGLQIDQGCKSPGKQKPDEPPLDFDEWEPNQQPIAFR